MEPRNRELVSSYCLSANVSSLPPNEATSAFYTPSEDDISFPSYEVSYEKKISLQEIVSLL